MSLDVPKFGESQFDVLLWIEMLSTIVTNPNLQRRFEVFENIVDQFKESRLARNEHGRFKGNLQIDSNYIDANRFCTKSKPLQWERDGE